MSILQTIIWFSVGIASIVCCVVVIRVSREESAREGRLSSYYKEIMNQSVKKRSSGEIERNFFLGFSETEFPRAEVFLFRWYSHSRHPYLLGSSGCPDELEAVDDWIRKSMLYSKK